LPEVILLVGLVALEKRLDVAGKILRLSGPHRPERHGFGAQEPFEQRPFTGLRQDHHRTVNPHSAGRSDRPTHPSSARLPARPHRAIGNNTFAS